MLTRKRPDGNQGDGDTLTDEGTPDRRSPVDALTLEGLLQRLQRVESRCGGYSVYSGSAYMSLDKDYEVRRDCALVGVARNHEDQVLGFLQHLRQQWAAGLPEWIKRGDTQ